MRQVKLLAAVTAVLLALTGFSHTGTSGKGSGGKSRSNGSSSSSGGGCSKKSTSSSSSNGSVYKSNGRNNTYRGGTGGGTGSDSSSTGRPTGRVQQCVTTTRTTATVRVDPRTRNGSHRVYVDFLDRDGLLVDSGSTVVLLKSGRTVDVDVPMARPEKAGLVTDCRLRSVS